MAQIKFDNIEEKFLETGDLFALEYNEGLVFFEVTGWEQLQFKPYEGFGSVAAGQGSDFQRLEHDGEDILHIGDETHKVLHVGIGHTPAQLRRYTNYPESENRLRTIPNLSAPRPRQVDDYGFVSGDDSSYDEPSDAEELFIPPKTHLDFAFANPDESKAHTPLLNIKMREYKVKPLDPRKNGNAVSRILQPGSPIPIAPVGSIDNQTTFNMDSDWDVTPVKRSNINK